MPDTAAVLCPSPFEVIELARVMGPLSSPWNARTAHSRNGRAGIRSGVRSQLAVAEKAWSEQGNRNALQIHCIAPPPHTPLQRIIRSVSFSLVQLGVRVASCGIRCRGAWFNLGLQKSPPSPPPIGGGLGDTWRSASHYILATCGRNPIHRQTRQAGAFCHALQGAARVVLALIALFHPAFTGPHIIDATSQGMIGDDGRAIVVAANRPWLFVE